MTAPSVHEKLIERLRAPASEVENAMLCVEAANAIKALEAECERRIEAYQIAHDQAMANGERASTLQNRVGVLTRELERLYTLEGVEWGEYRSQAVSNAISRVAALGGEA